MVGINKYAVPDAECIRGYRSLTNAVPDAEAVENALADANVKKHKIVSAFNCDAEQLFNQTNAFLSKIEKDDAVIVYAAAHGLEYQNAQRLLASSANDQNFVYESLSIHRLRYRLVT